MGPTSVQLDPLRKSGNLYLPIYNLIITSQSPSLPEHWLYLGPFIETDFQFHFDLEFFVPFF